MCEALVTVFFLKFCFLIPNTSENRPEIGILQMFALMVRRDNTCDHVCPKSDPRDLSAAPNSPLIPSTTRSASRRPSPSSQKPRR
jgi:hypothetical protein